MHRNERDIIEKMKEYAADENTIYAMADILLFMGIAEAPDFAVKALDELKQERQDERELQRAYTRHLAKGFGHYMSYENFKAKRKAGEI